MLNDVIGGGQVFLHKVRMLSQVAYRAVHLSFIAGIILSIWINFSEFRMLDFNAILSFKQAELLMIIDDIASSFRGISDESNKRFSKKEKSSIMNANTATRSYFDIEASRVVEMSNFRKENDTFNKLLWSMFLFGIYSAVSICGLVFLLWSRFGNSLREEKVKSGAKLLDGKEVRRTLTSLGKASAFRVGSMPLVKDSETMHLLVTGSTGSGKTNFMHNLLPQIEKKKQPAIVIDQTGEMIAKYYDADRGDIIFNPFDDRSHAWDIFADCSSDESLERFSHILMSFNRKSSGSRSDPFWDKSASEIFESAFCHLRDEFIKNQTTPSIKVLNKLIRDSSIGELKFKLHGTAAKRYLESENNTTAASILATLTTSSKPLTYLRDHSKNGVFSLKSYFQGIKEGKESWLFLATKPSNRMLTLPLIACMTELALSELMDIGIDDKRRVWFVLDELASLGNLPGLSQLMTEGRKYGACVLAALQSLNQLYEHYGQYSGSKLFGQFATLAFFRNQEEAIARMVSSMCGREVLVRHQKNTSFGANSYRDGVSYTEQETRKDLVSYNDLASLAIGECYMILPEPDVRLSKIKLKEQKLTNKNEGFRANNMTNIEMIEDAVSLKCDQTDREISIAEVIEEDQEEQEEQEEQEDQEQRQIIK